VSTLKNIWNRWHRALTHDRRQEILDLLCREYLEKSKDAIQFRHHAERMRYRQFREMLLRIAEEEENHAESIKKRIVALGGEVPRVSFNPEERWNSWEELRLDLEDERRRINDIEDQSVIVEQLDRGTADLLRRIFEDEKKHREAITEMLIRSDPQASLTT